MKKPTKKQQEEGLARIRRDVALGKDEVKGTVLFFKVRNRSFKTTYWDVSSDFVNGLVVGIVAWSAGINGYVFSSESNDFGWTQYSLRDAAEFCESLTLAFHKTRQ